MKKIILLLMLVFMVLVVNNVNAVECGVTPTEDCTVSADTTFDFGTYYFNDTNSNGAIRINANDITLDCNNSLIIGNDTVASLRGIQNVKNNITIKNCNLQNYRYGILTSGVLNFTIKNNSFSDLYVGISFAKSNNSLLEDNSFSNFSLSGISIEGSSHNTFNNNIFNSTWVTGSQRSIINTVSGTAISENNIIKNNIIYGNNLAEKGFIITESSTSLTIRNNTFYNHIDNNILVEDSANMIIENNTMHTTIKDSIYFTGMNTNFEIGNNTIRYNNVYNVLTLSDGGIFMLNDGGNNTINNNLLDNCSRGIYLDNSSNGLINNNIFNGEHIKLVDNRGIYIDDSENVIVEYNTINNIDVGIDIRNLIGSIVRHNNINNATFNNDWFNIGIKIYNVTNITIFNNTIDLAESGILMGGCTNCNISKNNITLANTTSFVFWDAYEAPAGILILELYKTYSTCHISQTFDSDITNITQCSSDNINIEGNTFNNANIFLRTQGTTNLVQDLTNYWFKSFQFPTFLVDRDDFYINNNYNKINMIRPTFYDNLIKQGKFGVRLVNFTIFNDYMYFGNENNTETYQLNLYNQTNALIYYSNNSGFICQGSQVNCNVTLAPLEYVYVVDHYDLSATNISMASITGLNLSFEGLNITFAPTETEYGFLWRVWFWVNGVFNSVTQWFVGTINSFIFDEGNFSAGDNVTAQIESYNETYDIHFYENVTTTINPTMLITSVDINYTSPVVESSIQSLILNITYDQRVVNNTQAIVTYNNTNYTTTKTNEGINRTSFKTTLTIPLVETHGLSKSLNWSLTITQNDTITQGGYVYNRSFSGTQIVNQIDLTNCTGTGGNSTINFLIKDEDSPDNYLNSTLELEIEYWKGDDSVTKKYNDKIEGSYNYTICLSNVDETTYANGYIRNTATDSFTHRYYFYNLSLTNETRYIDLFNFNLTTGKSDLKITLRDKNTYNYYSNIIGSLQRRYITEGVWRTVQMYESDDFGLNFFNIIEETTDYKLVFKDRSNNILKTSDQMSFACTSGVCELTFLLDPFLATATYQELTYDLDYGNETGLITLNWNDPTGATSSVRLHVTKETMTGTSEICNTEGFSSTGTLTCDVSAYTGEVLVRVFDSASPEKPTITEWIKIVTISLGNLIPTKDAVFWSFGIMVTIIGFGIIISPIAGVITTIIGLITLLFLGLFSPLTITFVIIACIIGIVVGIQLKR